MGLDFADILEYLNPVREFLESPTVSELMINADLSVFVEERGRKREVPGCRLNRADIGAAVKRIARADNTEPGDSNPIINVRLGDGSSRICMVLPPASPDGVTISIRKFRPYPFTAEELIEQGSLPRSVFEVLASAIAHNENILIAGGFGTGKTTLLNVLASEIPLEERICLLEFPPELQLPHRNQVSLQASDDLPFSTLIKKAVTRLGPDRIILGEVRGEEAFDLLRALNLGLRGSFATIHADSAEEALFTLASLATMAHENVNSSFIRDQVARAIRYVVHIARMSDGSRPVQELIRVGQYNDATRRFSVDRLYSRPALVPMAATA
jgi:pilus assembly protein CpaF